ncbi:MAG: hypothetical protein FWE04_06585 [Oscillospiraceae bacterium]|nr:hypothetical protein [Oscillospiraceae bacterium]
MKKIISLFLVFILTLSVAPALISAATPISAGNFDVEITLLNGRIPVDPADELIPNSELTIITDITNNTPSVTPLLSMAALYSSGRMVEIDYYIIRNLAVSADTNITKSISIPNRDLENYEVRIFVWELETMNPIATLIVPEPEVMIPPDLNTPRGSGTVEDPFLLSTPAHLEWMNGNLPSRLSYHYRVINDIVAPRNFMIGGIDNPFTSNPFLGSFDGGGHTITVDINMIGNDIGLFRSIGMDGIVRNLMVAGNVTGIGFVGGVAGYNQGKIKNVTVTANVSAHNVVGGIVGVHSAGTIENSIALNSSIIASDTGFLSIGRIWGLDFLDLGGTGRNNHACGDMLINGATFTGVGAHDNQHGQTLAVRSVEREAIRATSIRDGHGAQYPNPARTSLVIDEGFGASERMWFAQFDMSDFVDNPNSLLEAKFAFYVFNMGGNTDLHQGEIGFYILPREIKHFDLGITFEQASSRLSWIPASMRTFDNDNNPAARMHISRLGSHTTPDLAPAIRAYLLENPGDGLVTIKVAGRPRVGGRTIVETRATTLPDLSQTAHTIRLVTRQTEFYSLFAAANGEIRASLNRITTGNVALTSSFATVSGVQARWESLNPEIILDNGVVLYRPGFNDTNRHVRLRATLSVGLYERAFYYDVEILRWGSSIGTVQALGVNRISVSFANVDSNPDHAGHFLRIPNSVLQPGREYLLTRTAGGAEIARFAPCAGDYTVINVSNFVTGSTAGFTIASLDSGFINLDGSRFVLDGVEESVIDAASQLRAVHLGSLNAVISDLTFPAYTHGGLPIEWSSSNPRVINEQGEVTRPQARDMAVFVKLTATVNVNGFIYRHSFIARVPRSGAMDGELAPLTDPMHMSDEQFFGRWNSATNSWDIMPVLRYDTHSGLRYVEAYVRLGNYYSARFELQRYFQNRTGVPQWRQTTNGNPFFAEAMSEMIFGWFQIDLPVGWGHVGSEWGWHSIDLNRNLHPTFFLMDSCMNGSTVEIHSRENPSGNTPYLSIVANGVTHRRPAIADTHISAGVNATRNFGNAHILLVREAASAPNIPFGSYTKRPYLRFDISGISGNITSVHLNFYGRTDASNPQRVFALRPTTTGQTQFNEMQFNWRTHDNMTYNFTETGFVWLGDGSHPRGPNMYYRDIWGVQNQEWVFYSSRMYQARWLVPLYLQNGNELFAYRALEIALSLYAQQPDPFYSRQLDSGWRAHSLGDLFFGTLNSEHNTPEVTTAQLKNIYSLMRRLTSVSPSPATNQTNAAYVGFLRLAAHFPELMGQMEVRGTNNNAWRELVFNDINYMWPAAGGASGDIDRNALLGNIAVDGDGNIIGNVSDVRNWDGVELDGNGNIVRANHMGAPRNWFEFGKNRLVILYGAITTDSVGRVLPAHQQWRLTNPDGSYLETTNGYIAGVLNEILQAFDIINESPGVTAPYSAFLLNAYNRLAKYFVDFMMVNGHSTSFGNGGRINLRVWAGQQHARIPNPHFQYIATSGQAGIRPDYTSIIYPDKAIAFLRDCWNGGGLSATIAATQGAGTHGFRDDLMLDVFAYGRPMLTSGGATGFASTVLTGTVRAMTRQHNTIEIDNMCQMPRPGQNFPAGMPTRPPGSPSYQTPGRMTLATNDMFDFVDAGSSYIYWPTHDVNRRVLQIRDRFWIVSDSIRVTDVNRSHTYRLFWQPDAGNNLTVDQVTGAARTNWEIGGNLLIIPADPETMTANITNRWMFSPGFGEIYTPRMEYVRIGTGHQTFDSILFPFAQGRNPNVTVTRLPLNVPTITATALMLNIDGNTAFYYSSNEAIPIRRRFGDFWAQAQMAYIERDQSGNIINIYLTNATSLDDANGNFIVEGNLPSDLGIEWRGNVLNISSSENLPSSGIRIRSSSVGAVRFNGRPVQFTFNNGVVTTNGTSM